MANSPHGSQCEGLVINNARPRTDFGASLRRVSNSGVPWNRSSAPEVTNPMVRPARMSR